jgi:magnesium-transporting ATPase (P-type)
MENFSKQAYRVILFSYKDVSLDECEHLKETPEKIEKDLIFLGIFGMIDPLKEGVVKSIETC